MIFPTEIKCCIGGPKWWGRKSLGQRGETRVLFFSLAFDDANIQVKIGNNEKK